MGAKSETNDTPLERAAQYRRLADEAEALARQTLFEDSRQAYLKCAKRWRDLAAEAESETKPWFSRLFSTGKSRA